MPNWLREILISASVALVTLTAFALAISFGVFVSISIGDASPWLGVVAAIGFLLFVVLPIRLWWVLNRARRTGRKAPE
jgi:hypothetical protein